MNSSAFLRFLSLLIIGFFAWRIEGDIFVGVIGFFTAGLGMVMGEVFKEPT